MENETLPAPVVFAWMAEWIRIAAEQGNAKAQFNLGNMYTTGKCELQDYAEGLNWYHKAADQGYAPAQLELGLKYFICRGIPQDYVLAHMWVNLSISRFTASEKKNRERAEESRKKIASKMTPAQIAEA